MAHCSACRAFRGCRKYRGIFVCERAGCWRQRKVLHANNLYTRKVAAEKKQPNPDKQHFNWTCRKEG